MFNPRFHFYQLLLLILKYLYRFTGLLAHLEVELLLCGAYTSDCIFVFLMLLVIINKDHCLQKVSK